MNDARAYEGVARERYIARRYEATKAVTLAVAAGRLAPIKTKLCITCGASAIHYHHVAGYEVGSELNVQPMCGVCHKAIHHAPSLSDDDAADVRAAFRQVIREQGGQNLAAVRLGISKAYMSDLLKNRRQPGPVLLRKLGLRKVTEMRYERIV